ncbi:hypothetical protein Purlil1_1648 [Purpureocillium lilacinum]|uniref:Uncharacterized protein n=1 Tax=Purpureocillium lilacinum TaxID=33203 RepID=A0ABR0CD71_PURLI|nr:hypothetical protein Purlil1_1648 [Purpureocillium lilacinum]
MLRDWGPGSVQEKIVASGAKGSPCAGVQSAQNAPGMARGGGGGGGGEKRRGVRRRAFSSAARPRAAAAFYFSQSDSQDKLPTPARPTRGRRCVMPGRAGPAGASARARAFPVPRLAARESRRPVVVVKHLKMVVVVREGGTGIPLLAEAGRKEGDSPSLVEWAGHGSSSSSSSSSRVDNDAAVHVRLPGQLLRRRLPPHGRPASRCGQEPQGASPSRPPTCSGVLAPLRGRIQGPTGAAGIDAPQTPGTETGSRLGGSVQRRRTGTTAQHSGTPHFASETHCTPVGCVSPRDTLTTAKPVSVGIARILSPAPERVLHAPTTSRTAIRHRPWPADRYLTEGNARAPPTSSPPGAWIPSDPTPSSVRAESTLGEASAEKGPLPPPCPAAIDAPPPALSRLSETWNPIVVIASSPGGGHASLPKAGATHQHAPAKPQAACRTGFPSGSC